MNIELRLRPIFFGMDFVSSISISQRNTHAARCLDGRASSSSLKKKIKQHLIITTTSHRPKYLGFISWYSPGLKTDI